MDLVTDPATVSNLWEGRKIAAKKVKDVLLDKAVMEALSAGRQKRLRAICETMDDSMAMEGDDEGKDHRDHLYSAMRACEEAGDDETAGKIHKLLGPAKKDKEDAEDDDAEPTEEADDDEPAEKAEEAKIKTPTPGATTLTEAKAKALCKLAGIPATAELMESVVGLPEDRAVSVLALVKGNGSQTAPSRGQAPRSQGQRTQTVTESRVAKDAKEQAAILLS